MDNEDDGRKNNADGKISLRENNLSKWPQTVNLPVLNPRSPGIFLSFPIEKVIRMSSP